MSAINRIAHAAKVARGLTWGDALRYAHKMVKNSNEVQLITFVKKSGKQTTRVVSLKWTDFVTPVGGPRRPKGMRIVADLAKAAAMDYPIISFYADMVVSTSRL